MTANWNECVTGRLLMLASAVMLLSGCGLNGKPGNVATAARYETGGQYRAAYIESKKVLQHDSQNGKAWLLLGKASLMLGNPEGAIHDLQHAKALGVPVDQWAIPMGRALRVTQQFDILLKTLSPADVTLPTDRARLLVLRGDAYFALKKRAQAKQAYQAAIAVVAGDPAALVGLARIAASEHDLGAAHQYVQQALVSSPDDVKAWIFRGDLAFGARAYAAAQADYTKALGFKSHDLLPQERFNATARLADSEIQQNDLGVALSHIDTLEKMAPQQPYPHYLHAVVYYKQGHFNDAIYQLQQVLKAIPDSEPAQLLMGATNYAQGNFSQADMYLSNVLGLDQANVAARRLLALTMYREGESQQALKVLRPTVPGRFSDTTLLAMMQKAASQPVMSEGVQSGAHRANSPFNSALGAAQSDIATGHVAAALYLLKSLHTSSRPEADARLTLMVMAYIREKQAASAVKVASQFVVKDPQDATAHLLYGTALIAARKKAEARAQYIQALQLDPQNIAALMSLGSLNAMEHHYHHAANRYEAVLKVMPADAQAMMALGRLAELSGARDQAVSWYKQAVRAQPKAAAPYLQLIALYTDSGQFADALAMAKGLVGIAPHDSIALNALGVAEINVGHQTAALKPLQQAVQAVPGEGLYRINLARAQILNKDFTDAEGNLSDVVRAEPDAVSAVTLLAVLKLRAGDRKGALALAQALEGHPPTRVAGLALEGDLYMIQHAYAKAAQTYRRALKLAYSRPLVVKTFLAEDKSGERDADRVVRVWLEKNPHDDAMRMLLGQYYSDQRTNGLAVAEFQQVLKDYPSNIAAMNNLAWLYSKQSDPRALPLAARAHTLAPDVAAVTDTYAWVLIEQGQPQKALPLLQQVVKASPATPAFRYHLAVAQARTGDKAAAAASLHVLLKSKAGFPERAAAEKLYRDLAGRRAG